MLQGLECCWLGQFGQYAERPPCEALVGYMDRVRDNGFDWALAECLAVMPASPICGWRKGARGPRQCAARRLPRSTPGSARGR